MFNPIHLIDRVLTLFASVLLPNLRKLLEQFEVSLRGDPDEVLRQKCVNAYTQSQSADPQGTKKQRIKGLVHKLLGAQAPSSSIVFHLALGVESFARAPADLPDGSRLTHPQQTDAALALISRCVIQMNTGEGKTYAILPAAFALACRHRQCVIICANEYLAHRDAQRTSKFWSFVGLRQTYANKNSPDEHWAAPVVYATMDGLTTRVLHVDNRDQSTDSGLKFGAMLLDEADAILLDSNRGNRLVVPIRRSAANWSRAIELAAQLEEKRHIEVDREDLTALLTVEGEAWLKAQKTEQELSPQSYLVLRQQVELAYIGTRVAKMNDHYVMAGGRLIPYDMHTGMPAPTQTPGWIHSAEFKADLKPRPHNVEIDWVEVGLVLSLFDHLAGLSGTTTHNVFEYFIHHHLLPITIPPGNPRKPADASSGDQDDLVFYNTEYAINHICEAAVEAVQAGRPVFIGTLTVDDTHAVAQQLSPMLPDGTDLRVLTGMNEQDLVDACATAGRPGCVLVATQQAGRGIDIRLTDEARAAGGFVQLALGHRGMFRHDLQFRGRVGRRGDPFRSQFICALNDPFMRRFAGERTESMLRFLGMDEDAAIEHRMVTKSIRRAQRQMRLHEFRKRTIHYMLHTARRTIWMRRREWIKLLQLRNEEKPDCCSPDFIDFAVSRYYEQYLQPICGDRGNLNAEQTSRVLQAINATLEPASQTLVAQNEIEGHSADGVRKIITQKLTRAISAAAEENSDARESFRYFMYWDKQVKRRVMLIRDFERRLEQRLTLAREQDREQAPDSEGEIADPHEPYTLPRRRRRIRHHRQRAIDLKHRWVERCQMVIKIILREEDQDDLVRDLNYLRDTDIAATDGQTTDQLDRYIDAAEKVLGEVASRCEALARDLEEMADSVMPARCVNRTPRQIGIHAVRNERVRYILEMDRAWHVSARSTGHDKPVKFINRLQHLTQRAWKSAESDTAVQVLRSLLQADRPQELDELFSLHDTKTHAQMANPNQPLTIWVPPKSNDPSARSLIPQESTSEHLLSSFVRSTSSELHHYAKMSEAQARRLLREFLVNHPPYSLISPSQISQAMLEQRDRDLENQLPGATVRQRQDYLWKFLRTLERQSLISKLPAPRERLVFSLKTIADRLFNRSAVILTASLALAVVAMLFISRVMTFARPIEFSGLRKLAADILFGPLLAWQSVTAAAVGAILLGPILVKALFPKTKASQRGLPLEQLTTHGLLVLLCIALTGWPEYGGLGAWAAATAVAATMFVVGLVLYRIVFLLAIVVRLRLESGWLALTTLAWLIPSIGGQTDAISTPALILVTLLIATGVLLGLLFNRVDLQMISSHSSDVANPETAQEVQTHRTVQGYCGITPHLAGFVMAWLAVVVFLPWAGLERTLSWAGDGGLKAIALCIYLSVVAVWVYTTLRLRLSGSRWREVLSRNRQQFAHLEEGHTIESMLHKPQWRLMLREWPIQALTVLVPTLVFWNITVPGSDRHMPLGLLIVAAAVLFADQATSFATHLYHTAVSRTHYYDNTIDLSHDTGPTASNSRWRKLWGGGIKLAVVGIVIKVFNDTFEFLSNIGKFFQLVTDLFS